MKNPKQEELERIIEKKQIEIVFQPIISLKDGSILGHEALSRITEAGEIKTPSSLFETAETYNRLWDLELLCRNKAFETAFLLMKPPYPKKLFINVNPNIMYDDKFRKGLTKEFLDQHHITSHNIIFEITERNFISDINGFVATINHYKGQNYQIAIDDAGAGYSGLNLISDIHPNYIKLDMKLIRDIQADNLKCALVKGMADLSHASQISIIAEGIETEDELKTLIDLGVEYGQGYLIQRPQKEIAEMKKEMTKMIIDLNQKKKQIVPETVSSIAIGTLCFRTDTVGPAETVLHVYDWFRHKSNFFGLCVVENEKPVGIVTRENLSYQLSGYYGFTLNQKKPVSCVMDQNFLSVDDKMPINIVSSMAMARPYDKLYDFIVVTKDGKYLGTVTIKDLLEKATEMEVNHAKRLNPLTELAGNIVIENKIQKMIDHHDDYSVAYFDIDNFKAYNDVYGFSNGDLVIKLLADILKSNFSHDQFVGHIGGDDFLVIVDKHVTCEFFQDACRQFEKEVLNFYKRSDIELGFIIAANRQGKIEKFPLMTVTCVSMNNQDDHFKEAGEFTEVLAARKKLAKHKIRKSYRLKI